MELVKSQWSTDGDNYSIAMPLSKVDKENRTVSGWASLDNPDLQGDIVLADASEKAFARFRGNIREMHQPIAVGRMLSYRPDSYYDSETQKFYNGIFVTVYVSKGAQNTWEKVLDGTLQAFSIKGPIVDSEMEFSKDANRPLRIIKDYDLEELSLVDSGGNQLANVMSISKSNGSYVVKGMVADIKTENVFYCSKHEKEIAKTSTEDSAVCPEGHTMQNIGWFEYDDSSDKTAKVRGLIEGYHSSNTTSAGAEIAKQGEPANNEGGVDVAEETETAPEVGSAVPAEVAVGEQGKAQTEVDASVENVGETATAEGTEAPEEEAEGTEAASVSEVEAVEPDFAKMFGDLQSAIESKLQKVAENTEAAIAKVNEAVEAKVSELTDKHDELAKTIEGFKTSLGSVETTVKSLESDTAVKKSGDLGGSTEDSLEKSNGSRWGGHFLGITDLQ